MTTAVTTYPGAPYWDDFDSNKNFYRILFKPGYAVQARELTQLQTQIQNQISKFGSSIYQDGTVIIGGERVLDNNAFSIKIDPTYGGNPVVLSNFITQVGVYHTGLVDGNRIVGQTSGTIGIVSFAIAAINSDPNTFLVKIVSGSKFVAGEIIMLEGSGTIGATIQSSNPFNSAITYSINDGIFFVGGNFVHCPAQSIVVDKYLNTSDWNVGFVIEETVVNAIADTSLLEPASGTPNYAAPGADRYCVNLILTAKAYDTVITSFYEIARLTNGGLTINKAVTVYSELAKEFARRTYDESGDYTVKLFNLSIKDHIGSAKAVPVIVSGQVTALTLIEGGAEYSTTPTVTIEDTGGGTGAVYTAVVNLTTGAVTGFTQISTGSGYTSAAIVKISGDSTKLSAVLDPGKAYVKGFEFETIAQSYVSIPKARTFGTVDSSNTSPNYGNYLYTKSLVGIFDTTVLTTVELHSVAQAAIGTSTVASVSSVTTLLSKVITSSAAFGGVVAGMTVTGTGIPAGAIVTLVSSTSSITINYAATATGTPSLSFTVTRSGTAQVRFLRYTSGTVGTSAAIYKMFLFNIVMNTGKLFKDIESIGIRPVTSYTAAVDIDLNSKVGGLATGDVFLTDSGFATQIFNMSNSFIKTAKDLSSVSHTNYTFQRTFNSVAFTGGVAVISTNNGTERFMGGTGIYSDSETDIYYIAIVTAAGTSGLAVGTVLRFNSAAGRSITGGTNTPGASQSLTLSTNSSTEIWSFTASIICTINGTAIPEKTKALSVWTGVAISTPATTQGGTNSLIRSDIFKTAKIYNTGNAIPTVVGSAGAVGTNGVYFDPVTNVPTWGSSLTAKDVTENYIINNGQQDEFYGNGYITLNGTPPQSTNNLVTSYKYFTHSGNGFFTIDSYSGIAFEDVPSYYSPSTGTTYRLGDCFDFRPRQGDSGGSFTGGQIPDSTVPINSTYEYYLPRTDLLLATSNLSFELKQGVPDLAPKVPVTETNGMILYILSIPPYTISPANIAVQYIENKRYTMRDIGLLEKRVVNLEYYTQLSLLEKQVQDEVINDASNLAKFKNGYVVDSFSGYSVGDMSNSDYFAVVNTKAMESQCPVSIQKLNFTFNSAASTNAVQHNDVVTSSYFEWPFVNQLTSSELINVNPFNVVDYVGAGSVRAYPPQDVWIDYVTLPPVIQTTSNSRVMTNSELAQAVNSRSDWMSLITTEWGVAPVSYSNGNVIVQAGHFNPGFNWNIQSTLTKDLTTTTTSSSSTANTVDTLITYLRSQNINVIGKNFKPNSSLKCFIDDTDMSTISGAIYGSRAVRPAPYFTLYGLTGTPFRGDELNGSYAGEVFYIKVGGSTIGYAKCLFSTAPLPSNSSTRYVYVYSLYLYVNGMVEQTAANWLQSQIAIYGTSYYSAVSAVTGAYASISAVSTGSPSNASIMTNEFGSVGVVISVPPSTFLCGTRVIRLIDDINPVLTKSSGQTTFYAQGTSDVTQFTTIQTTTRLTGSLLVNYWYDPLAQSFLVDSNLYPDGVCMTSVELFFGYKSSSVPVTVQICGMINGYPDTSNVYKNSVVTLDAAYVNTSLDATVATKFLFASPVFLPAGEYCFVVISNCNSYEVFASRMGGDTIKLPSQKITQQPYTGVLFKSQNNSTWTASQEEDLMFKLNIANFSKTGTAVFDIRDVPVTTITGDIVTSSPTISNVAITNGNDLHISTGANLLPAGVVLGMLVVGAGIPDNTTIIKVSDTTLTLSHPATATTTAAPLSGYPLYDYSVLNIKSGNTMPSGIDTVWGYKGLNTSNNIPAKSNGGLGASMDSTWSIIDVAVDNQLSNLKLIVPKAQNANIAPLSVQISWVSKSYFLSPLINVPALSAVLVRNLINNINTNETHALGGPASEALISGSISGTTLTVDSVNYGALSIGMIITSTTGTSISANTTITGIISASGGAGTYTVNNSQTVTTTAMFATNGNAVARYITKIVNLNDGFDASNLTVTFDGYKPAGTDFAVYFKSLPIETSVPMFTMPWVQMSLQSPVGNSTSVFDLRQHMYFPPGAFAGYGIPVNNPIDPRFNAFAVKIVYLSSNVVVTPKIRNFRAIALDS